MKSIMKNAVDKVFTLLWLRDNEPEKYRVVVENAAHSSRADGTNRSSI
jgi:hypothetical protein